MLIFLFTQGFFSFLQYLEIILYNNVISKTSTKKLVLSCSGDNAATEIYRIMKTKLPQYPCSDFPPQFNFIQPPSQFLSLTVELNQDFSITCAVIFTPIVTHFIYQYVRMTGTTIFNFNFLAKNRLFLIKNRVFFRFRA